MNKLGKTKITIGLLVMVILSASIYISLQDSVKLDVQKTRTKFSVWENESWVLGATEYVYLYDGTKKMRRKYDSFFESVVCRIPITLNGWCGLSWNISGNITHITRHSKYKDNITTTHIYKLDGTTKQVELFPVESKFICNKCIGKIVHFEYRDLLYEGSTRTAFNPEIFGHKMKIEWENNSDFQWTKVYQQKVTDKLIIRYKPSKESIKYNVRMFDPINLIKLRSINGIRYERIGDGTVRRDEDIIQKDNFFCGLNAKGIVCDEFQDIYGGGADGNGDGICQPGETCSEYKEGKFIKIK